MSNKLFNIQTVYEELTTEYFGHPLAIHYYWSYWEVIEEVQFGAVRWNKIW